MSKKKFKVVPRPSVISPYHQFRLFDFQTYDHVNQFRIQMFGVNEEGQTCSISVDNVKPFFYVRLPIKNLEDGPRYTESLYTAIKDLLYQKMKGDFLQAKFVSHHKLYEFTGNIKFPFAELSFRNYRTFQHVKRMIENGQPFPHLELYESKIPPLLRYFHIHQICPSGWIQIDKHSNIPEDKTTTCDYEFIVESSNIEPLPNKETLVPFKIASFDIEASSSHGDFPVPTKDYKRLASQIVDGFLITQKRQALDKDNASLWLKKRIHSAFSIGETYENVDKVFTKQPIDKNMMKLKIQHFMSAPMEHIHNDVSLTEGKQIWKITKMFEKQVKKMEEDSSSEQEEEKERIKYDKKKEQETIVSILLNETIPRDEKIQLCNQSMTYLFPALEGDQITFIGTTFSKYGEPEPYRNHCFVVGSCDKVEHLEIDSVSTERDLLLQWTQLIHEENPDIIIGYNIFGFDYEFMFQRAKELECMPSFTSLSRNLEEQGYKKNIKTGETTLEETKNVLASGEYNLHYPVISGRLQIDLLFYFRRDYNLASYKLDDVAGTFIRDDIKGITFDEDLQQTRLYTKNIAGVHVHDYIHLEITKFTTDYYANGKKFQIKQIQKEIIDSSSSVEIPPGTYQVFTIDGIYSDLTSQLASLKWGIAKDDVTPQDIFRLSKESASSRAIVAKYCIQDCNLVQHLMKKMDVITGYSEMSRICNVPIRFLVFRGQGIKLTSYVAKICREKNTLMPDLEPIEQDDGYEGAIVLPPKCAMYGDNPVACVDYSSLYPSIAKGWNLSPDSKVWTKTYDLKGELIKINDITITEENRTQLSESAEKYYHLPEYKYITVEFDTFAQVQKYTANGKLGRKQKEKCGKKVCCWAQGQEGIIPSIIGDLLSARKETRTKAENETDPFIANVLDKRQLGYKVTANSLYGQMGSSVSTFFEKDVAASITSIGRQMITYAKRMIEEVYENTIYTTKNGETVRTRSSYVYGDTDSVFFSFNLEELDGKPIRGTKALEITIELAQEAAQLCSNHLPPPMKLTYEKTLMSFILLSKKRYVGILYEFNPNKGKLKFMGLPLKRRDSCDYLKDVYGGILTILMKEPENIQKALEFLNDSLKKLVKGNVSMDKLAITKSLRSDYKNPDQIAHKVLANRIGERDPGNKPKPGERMKYVFIQSLEKKSVLLGERIETLDYVTQKKLVLDYTYYITNQLMNPLQQLLGLALDKIYICKGKKTIEYHKKMEEWYKETNDLEVFMKKREKYCSNEIKMLLFDPFLTELYNKKYGIQTLHHFYSKTA